MRTRLTRNRGATLIVVLGVLMVLTLLATSFAALQRVERSVSRNFLHSVQAKAAARAGLETALARLSGSIQVGILNDPAALYWGGNVTESGGQDFITSFNSAVNLSYAFEDENPQNPTDVARTPMTFTIDGTPTGISGRMMSGTLAANADVYRLRVTDCNSLIHINDGVDQGPDGTVSRNLKRILNRLCDVLGIQQWGTAIVQQRPQYGYRSKLELRSILGSDFATLTPFLSARAWVDPNAGCPVPLSQETVSQYPVPYNDAVGLYRYGRSRSTLGDVISDWPMKFFPDFGTPSNNSTDGRLAIVLGMDEINAQWIEIVKRAPININAAPKEILQALVVDLRGLFVVERRRNNPNVSTYNFLNQLRLNYVPGGARADDYGNLYATLEYDMTLAGQVADEIIACRQRQTSPNVPGLDYGTVWYGGPMRTWRQFHAFCDGMVGTLLQDNRNIYYDCLTYGGFAYGTNNLEPSAIQPKYAAQAMADVLKANFNPNIHLNELNPNANHFFIVDKTDLITMSTEFCFTPMGMYEIRSEGLVIRTPDNQDFLTTREGTAVARKTIRSIVRLFDVHRDTSQADFHPGTSSSRGGAPVTNNNRTLEIGPEPDNGPAPQETRWSGWIQLSSIGGPWTNPNQGHAANTLESTPFGGTEHNSVAHAHYNFDHKLHHHADGSGSQGPEHPNLPFFKQNPDRTESQPGPYSPVTGHRLARDYDANNLPSTTGYFAPGDLRVDGTYVERDSSCMYNMSTSVFELVGTAAYWIKPSFHPEMSGRNRSFFSTEKMIPVQGGPDRYLMNGHWYVSAHDSLPFQPAPSENTVPQYPSGPWRPMAFVAGYSTKDLTNQSGGGLGKISPSLNHRSHTDTSSKDHLKHHEWIHVTYSWNMVNGNVQLLINGEELGGTGVISNNPMSGLNPLQDFVTENYFRLGNPTTAPYKVSANGKKRGRNWGADSTMDEFFLWTGNAVPTAQDLYALGRYHVPGAGNEGEFTSAAITFAGKKRNLAPPTTATPPGTAVSAAATTNGGQAQARVLAVAWTWYPEVMVNGEPKMIDWNTETGMDVEMEVGFLVNGQGTGISVTDDGGTPVYGVMVGPNDTFQYRILVRLPDADLNTILHATPIIDDITIFYSTGARYEFFLIEGVAL